MRIEPIQNRISEIQRTVGVFEDDPAIKRLIRIQEREAKHRAEIRAKYPDYTNKLAEKLNVGIATYDSGGNTKQYVYNSFQAQV